MYNSRVMRCQGRYIQAPVESQLAVQTPCSLILYLSYTHSAPAPLHTHTHTQTHTPRERECVCARARDDDDDNPSTTQPVHTNARTNLKHVVCCDCAKARVRGLQVVECLPHVTLRRKDNCLEPFICVWHFLCVRDLHQAFQQLRVRQLGVPQDCTSTLDRLDDFVCTPKAQRPGKSQMLKLLPLKATNRDLRCV